MAKKGQCTHGIYLLESSGNGKCLHRLWRTNIVGSAALTFSIHLYYLSPDSSLPESNVLMHSVWQSEWVWVEIHKTWQWMEEGSRFSISCVWFIYNHSILSVACHSGFESWTEVWMLMHGSGKSDTSCLGPLSSPSVDLLFGMSWPYSLFCTWAF